jgi:cytoskeletal protein CcmA (bactofilin family)
MNNEEILKKLDERLANGDITQGTYQKLKARYESETKEDISSKVKYRKHYSVSGISHVQDDLHVGVCSVSGSFKVEGSLFADRVDSSGRTRVEGDMRSDMVNNSGWMSVGGWLRSDRIATSGRLATGGDLRSGSIESSGSLNVGGRIRCDSLVSSGKVKADVLDAKRVEMELWGGSDVRELRGDSIEIKRGESRMMPKLVSESISGKRIYLECVRCEKVAGDDVTIGPNCVVDTVKFRDHLKIHKSSKVSKKVKKERGAVHGGG